MMSDLTTPLVETWRINSRILIYEMDAIATETLADRGATKGRSVGEMLAHIHNVRLMWLQSAAPDLLKGLSKIEKEAADDKALLRSSLQASAEAIASLIETAQQNGGKVKGFKPHVQAFVGYLIGHEFYHLGEIGVALQQSGHPLDRKTAFGIWEWGSR
jgi:uncharacterized damage-inducible protein DinB